MGCDIDGPATGDDRDRLLLTVEDVGAGSDSLLKLATVQRRVKGRPLTVESYAGPGNQHVDMSLCSPPGDRRRVFWVCGSTRAFDGARLW